MDRRKAKQMARTADAALGRVARGMGDELEGTLTDLWRRAADSPRTNAIECAHCDVDLSYAGLVLSRRAGVTDPWGRAVWGAAIGFVLGFFVAGLLYALIAPIGGSGL